MVTNAHTAHFQRSGKTLSLLNIYKTLRFMNFGLLDAKLSPTGHDDEVTLLLAVLKRILSAVPNVHIA